MTVNFLSDLAVSDIKKWWPKYKKIFVAGIAVFCIVLMYLLFFQDPMTHDEIAIEANRQRIKDDKINKFHRKVIIKDLIPSEYENPKRTLFKNETHLKKILIWNVFRGYGDSLGFGYGHGPFIESGCEVSSCLITNYRSLVPIEDFDAIIFHFRGVSFYDLPPKRPEKQRWVLFEIESRSYSFQLVKQFDNFFNWTLTFRKDSDIFNPYGRVVKNKYVSGDTDRVSSNRKISKKTKMAAWFVSNCFSHSRREQYVKVLQKFLKVDIFGMCGESQCSIAYNNDCYRMLEQDYLFYLSFENSLCKDYISEKLYNILRYRIVPVVMGGADYANIAPPHSFINALDFPDVKSLAKYLIYLSNNETAYNEYFNWKDKYSIHIGWSSKAGAFCDLCKKLHEDHSTKIYKDLGKWYDKDAQCNTLKWQKWMKRKE